MKYVFELENVHATLVEGKPRLVDKILRIPDPNAKNNLSAKMGLCDGMLRFFDRTALTLPAGLLPRVEKRLIKRGHAVSVIRAPSAVTSTISPCAVDYCIGIDMRDYQIGSVDASLREKRGLLWLSTNSGKSSVLSAISGKLVREARTKVLVIVPSAYLLKQTTKDIQGFLGTDIRVENAGGGSKQDPRRAQILVGTYQTLVRGVPNASGRASNPKLAEFISKCGAVLVDEAHHAPSASITAILRACKAAEWRIGMTGTVEKRDLTQSRAVDDKARAHRYRMEAYLGPVLYRVTNDEMVERGFSARPTIYVVDDRNAFGPVVVTPRPTPPGCGKPINIYQKVFDSAVIGDKRFRRTIIKTVATLLAQGKAPLLMSHSVKHLRRLAMTADKLKVPYAFITGDVPVSQRMESTKRFSENPNFALFGSTCVDEGMSINAVRSVVLAGTRKSPVEVLQRIGRGLRKKGDGSNNVSVIDFACPHSTLLNKHYKTRLATYQAEKFNVREVSNLGDFLAGSFE